MRDSRTHAREGRLLVVLACGTREPQVSDLDGASAIDFLLQHPSVLQRFATSGKHPWQPNVLPSTTETDSSEEALLGWKRSVAGDVVVPMLRRLLGRGLAQRRDLTLELTAAGVDTAWQLAAAMAPHERARVELVAGEFRADPVVARERVTSALSARGT
jgi:hypothetical protein